MGADDFRQLATGVVRDAPGDALAPMLAKLAALPGGSAVALDIVHMHLSCAQDDAKPFDPDLLRCGRELLAAAEFGEGTGLDDHSAGEVVRFCLAGVEGEEAARDACARIRARLDDYSLSAYRVGSLLRALFEAQPVIALDALLLGDGDLELRLDRPSPLDNLDHEVLGGWADVAGQINFRALANYVPVFSQTDPLGVVTKLAGQVADLNPGQPKFKANVTTTYENGPASITLNGRYLGKAKLQNAWRSGVDVDDNSVDDYLTFDLTGMYRIKAGGATYTFTFGIDNLFDRDPIDLPVIPGTVQYSAPGLGGRFDLYDPLGRTFRVGFRAKF